MRGLAPYSATTRSKKSPLLRRSPSSEALTNRHDIVIDGLGQADHGELIIVFRQVGGEVGGRGVGVVATDGVQHVDAILHESLSGNLKGILTFAYQASFHAILDVGQREPAVADGAAAVLQQYV